jgi:hypothetical protein
LLTGEPTRGCSTGPLCWRRRTRHSRLRPGGVRPGRLRHALLEIDEAVELACDTEYGLALGIFTADVATGLALAERIPTGTAHINDQTLRDDAHVPFGGVRNSGNASRFGTAAANIEAYTDTRWITVQPTPLTIPSDPSIGVVGRFSKKRH